MPRTVFRFAVGGRFAEAAAGLADTAYEFLDTLRSGEIEHPELGDLHFGIDPLSFRTRELVRHRDNDFDQLVFGRMS